MYEAINIFLFFVQLIIFIRAIIRLSRKIIDFGSIFEMIYFVWYVPVIYDMLSGQRGFDYVYYAFNSLYAQYFTYTPASITKYNLITTLIMVAFEIGYSSVKTGNQISFTFNTNNNPSKRKYMFVQMILLSIWLFLEVRGFFRYGGSLRGFFSSTNKDMYGMEVIEMLINKIPLILFSNYFYYNAANHKKRIGIFYWIIVILPVLQTHQRREMIANFLFAVIVYLCYYATIKNFKTLDPGKISKRIKRYIVYAFVVVICAVPLLWFLRVHDSQVINRGATQVVYTRNFKEVLLEGSGASGFPTLITFVNYGKTNGITYYLRQLLYTLEAYIPRSIFSGKLSSLNIYIKQRIGVSNNLSMFYINELFYTFDILAIPISFVIGRFFSKAYNRFVISNSFEDKIMMALFLSNIIGFFKNGLSSFMISTSLVMILLLLDFSYYRIATNFSFVKGKIIIRKKAG